MLKCYMIITQIQLECKLCISHQDIIDEKK
jgi:hypothetical protein